VAETAPYIVAALLAAGCWWFGLARLGVFTSDEVRAWRRLAGLRGYALPRSRIDKAVQRAGWLEHLQTELDLERLLALANRTESPLAFLGRSMGIGLLVFGGLLFALAVGRAALGEWPAPPWLVLAIGLSVLPVSVIKLRSSARRTKEAVGRTLGDMMTQVAVITDTRGLQLHDAVRLLSRCARDPYLANLIDADGYKRLVAATYRSTVEMYRFIGSAYGIPLFLELAEVATTTNVGLPERDAFTRLALAVYERRLTEARMRSARAKILVTLPVAAMLIPLLLLIAAPTLQALSTGLRGG